MNILREAQECLPQLKHKLNITDDSVFHVWLAEEWVYLLSQKEPEEETVQMMYWQRLVNLATSRYVIIQIPCCN